MSHIYQAISFNSQKKIYDRFIFWGVLVYLVLFLSVSLIFHKTAPFETLLLRATASGAFILLTLILMIGPLCRLSPRFLPLLYNRRHLGVTMFFLALLHGGIAILHFHGFGDINPLASLFLSNTDYTSLTNFPFQPLGFAALCIFLLMAATSHDFWLANLTAPIWKALHMLVYTAYMLVIGHVCLGALQSEVSPLLAIAVGMSLFFVLGLHLWSALRVDKGLLLPTDFSDLEGYAYVCLAKDIPENRAKMVQLSEERVAVFRYENKISAVSNVCQHQNGPLGEGKIIDGCITCPWHGYQYLPADGVSPPPFQEKVPTFHVKVRNGKVYVHPKPEPAGTYIEPAVFSQVLDENTHVSRNE